MSSLEEIISLFPERTNPNPFYAGFGNCTNDVETYQAIGKALLQA